MDDDFSPIPLIFVCEETSETSGDTAG